MFGCVFVKSTLDLPKSPSVNELEAASTSHLLVFCKALMSVDSVTRPLTAAMTVEFIKAALNEKRMDLVELWLNTRPHRSVHF